MPSNLDDAFTNLELASVPPSATLRIMPVLPLIGDHTALLRTRGPLIHG